ncbi:MAG: Crp/Fnr family transcriptional regulator [Cyclobacteriaceae bacterium]|nr:Crp/Fnr family transcriptional regulator [Cyclobacteriaceae bacterium]
MLVEKVPCEGCDNMECIINKFCIPDWKTLITHYRQDFVYEEGQNIFLEGQKVEGIYIIYSGKVKIYTSLGDKNIAILRLASDNDILGHRGYRGTDQDSVYPISAVTLTQTSLTFIPCHIFDSLLKTNNELCYWLMSFYANELKNSENRTAKQAYFPVLSRIALALVTTLDAFGYSTDNPQKLSYTPTRTDLAVMANTTYESLIRGLKELERNEWIALKKKEVYILKEGELRNMVNPETK